MHVIPESPPQVFLWATNGNLPGIQPRLHSPQIPAALSTSPYPSEEWILALKSSILKAHEVVVFWEVRGIASWFRRYTQFNGPLCRMCGITVWAQSIAGGGAVASSARTGVVSGLPLTPQSLSHGWGRLVMAISVLSNIFLHKLCKSLLSL